MTKVVFPAFSNNEVVSPYEVRQLVSALELRFQSLEIATQEDTFPTTDTFDEGYAPISHTHTESDITDLGTYLTDIAGESIFDLSDVSGTPTLNQILSWDGAQFLPIDPPSGGGGVNVLDDLSDVSIPSVNDNDILQYNSGTGQWEPAVLPPSVTSLAALTDTDVTGLAVNDMLYWNGVDWIPTGAMTWDGEHLLLPQSGDNVTPTLAFGDGDSGFHEESDDQIRCTLQADDRWVFDISFFGALNTARAALKNQNATATNPNIVPVQTDTTTGIGRNAVGELSLIASATEVMRLTTTGANLQDLNLTRPEILDYGVTHQSPTVTGNAVTVDCEAGNSATIDMDPATADVTLTLSNPPASGTYGEVQLHIIMGTPAYEMIWPGSITWQGGGTAPALTTTDNAVDIVHLYTLDGGTSWYGTYALAASSAAALADLTDVDLTGQAQYDLLYNVDGTNWEDTGGFVTWDGTTFKTYGATSSYLQVGHESAAVGFSGIDIYGKQGPNNWGARLALESSVLEFKGIGGTGIGGVRFSVPVAQFSGGTSLALLDGTLAKTTEMKQFIDGFRFTTDGAYYSFATGYVLALAGIESRDDVDIRDGSHLYIRDTLDGDWADFHHDGLDFNTDFTNTVDWNLTGLTGGVQLNDLQLIRPEITDYGVTHQVLTISTATTPDSATIDCEAGNSAYLDLENAVEDIEVFFSNPPASGTYGEFVLYVEQGTTARSITWPGTITWMGGGSAPALSTTNNVTDILHFSTKDGGATWYGTAALNAVDAISLDDLTDATITTPTTGDLLRYNGSLWVNYPDSNYAPASHVGTGGTGEHPLFATASTVAGFAPGSNSLGATYYLDGSGNWSVPPGGVADGVTTHSTLRWSGSAWVENTRQQFNSDGDMYIYNSGGSYSVKLGYGGGTDFIITRQGTSHTMRVNSYANIVLENTNLYVTGSSGANSGWFSCDNTGFFLDGQGGGDQFKILPSLHLKERSAATGDASTYGQVWVNSTDDHLYYTNDTGTDYQVSGVAGTDDLADVTGRGATTATASTFSGGLTLSTSNLNTPNILDYTVNHTAPTVSGNAVTINLNNGNSFLIDMDPATADVTLSFSNIPASEYAEVNLTIVMGTPAYDITWPGSVTWQNGGSAPTLTNTNNVVDIVHLYTVDGGTEWFGTYALNAGAAAGVDELNDLSDVVITSAATGDILRFNGSNWVDYPDSNYLPSSDHPHSTFDRASSVLSGATVFSNIVVTDGITTAIATRDMSINDLGGPYNNYSHPNHTGEITSVGDGDQTLTVSAITNRTALTTGLAGTDELLINDGGVLKRMDVSVMNAYFDANLSFGYGTVTQVNAGNGMDFTAITSTGDVTMGTPGTLSGSSANGVTATSHTHGITTTGSGNIMASQGATLTGQFNCVDYNITRPTLDDYSIEHTAPTVSSNAVTVNCENGNSFLIDMDPATAAVTLTLSNPPASGTYGEVSLLIVMGTPAYDITWPGTVTWQNGGSAPSLSTTNDAVDLVHLFTVDGGTNWYGTYALASAAVGGASALNELSDVTLTSPADAALMIYDTGTAQWRDFIMSGDASMTDAGVVTVANDSHTHDVDNLTGITSVDDAWTVNGAWKFTNTAGIVANPATDNATIRAGADDQNLAIIFGNSYDGSLNPFIRGYGDTSGTPNILNINVPQNGTITLGASTSGGTLDLLNIDTLDGASTDADFDVLTATSFGGITSANLLDKTAAETISAGWTFTTNQTIQSTAPQFIWHETGAPTNELKTHLLADSGVWQIRTYDTSGGLYDKAYQINRTGRNVDSHVFMTDGSTTVATVHTDGLTVVGTMAATTVTGANVTTGSDPGHTHTAYGAGTVTNVNDGNGMTFTAITGSGDVTMGTPGSITDTSTNSVSTNSHTHAVSHTGSGNFVMAASPTLTGTVTLPTVEMSASQLNDPHISDYSIDRSTITATATTTLNYSTAQVYAITMNANITTLSISNEPVSGRYGEMTLKLIYNSATARTIDWTDIGVKWGTPGAPTLTSVSGKHDVIHLWTDDGGASWYGSYVLNY